MEHIYALYRVWNEEKIYFYVGRSKRAPHIRFSEHQNNARNTKHTEDVYRYIREQATRCDIQLFEQEILCEVDSNNADDYEDFYVVKLIRAGHDLKNMKHGDARRIAATELANSAEVIESVSDVKRYKERKQREAYERSEALKREVLSVEQTSKMSGFFQKIRDDALEARRIEEEKRRVRVTKKQLRDAEYSEWIKQQSHLFEAGEIDALGNRIK